MRQVVIDKYLKIVGGPFVQRDALSYDPIILMDETRYQQNLDATSRSMGVDNLQFEVILNI